MVHFILTFLTLASPLLASDVEPAAALVAVALPTNDEILSAEEGRADQFFSEFFNMLFTLGIILLVLMIIMWVLRRATSARMEALNTTSNIKIIERRSLAPKSVIYVLDVCGTRLIVGETPAGLARLGELPPTATTFAQVLQGQGKKEEERGNFTQ